MEMEEDVIRAYFEKFGEVGIVCFRILCSSTMVEIIMIAMTVCPNIIILGWTLLKKITTS